MTEPRTVTFVLPELLPVPPAVTQNELPECRALTRLISRADRGQCSPDYYQLLFERFGVQVDVEHDWPVASLAFLAETEQQPHHCLRADPVHLSASRDGMALMDNAMIGLHTDEALALAAELQPLFTSFQAELIVPHVAHWYLDCADLPAIRTTSLADVIARDVSTALPVGRDQTRWRQLFNEIQMVLHTSEVNEARGKRGLLPVNSLWFWGAGSLPVPGTSSFDYCVSDDPFVRGLGLLHEQPVAALTDSATSLLAEAGEARQILVVDDSAQRIKRYDNVPGWLQLVAQLEQHWLLPLEKALRRGRIDELRLIIAGQVFTVRRPHQWRFWRRGSLLNSDQH